MKHLIRSLFVFCLFGYGIMIQAQGTIPAAGGNVAGAGGTVSFTVGQVAYTTFASAAGSVAQGVQQPYEISVPTGLEEAKDIDLVFSAYPNPAKDFLTLKIKNYDNQNLSYMLYDINGIPLENKKVTGNEVQISMGNLLPSVYFLKVIDDQKEIKTFKIVKN